MSYPTTESPSTAVFWSDVTHTSGVCYNGQCDNNQFAQSESESTAAKGSTLR